MKLNLSRLISNLSFSKTSVVNVSGTNELTRAQSTLMTKKKKINKLELISAYYIYLDVGRDGA